MHEMEEGVRSSGGLIKKKNSSGCLIIKKRVDGSRKVFESNKERKRSRMVLSESGSSDDDSEPSKRKAVSKTESFYNSSVGRNGKIESKMKSRLDVSEFDANNAVDGKSSRNDYGHHRFKHTIRRWNESEFETGSSRLIMIEKRKKSYFDSGRNSSRKKVSDYTFMNRLEAVDNKTHSPIRQKVCVPSDEPIRLQGKNGVLKVMLNKKTKIDVPSKFRDRQLVIGDRKSSTSEIAIKKKDKSIGPSFYSDSKRPEKVIPIIRAGKSEDKGRKPVSKGDSETEHSFRPGSPSGQTLKGVRKTDGIAPSAENLKCVKGKEVKIKHGSGTEKQFLREKIRHMLISAGWTIDYRPRRNRDYLDAVYINPSGTAYWSIVKAYDAFRKQHDQEDADVKPSGDSSQFMPLPDELLSKLTRQTQKKIQRELKMKRKHQVMAKRGKGKKEESAEDTNNDNVGKQSFHKKHIGKSPKRRSDGTSGASGDDSSSNLSPKPERSGKQSTVSSSHIIQGRKTQKIGRCTLLIRSSDKKVNSESDGYVPYTGKRTVLSWLIDSGVLHLSERVQYMNRKRSRTMLEGWATRDGIHCGCCSKILSVSKFEIHAGSKLRQPFQNIYLESGISLSQCQIEAWNRQEESSRNGFHTAGTDGDDSDDDTCGLCGDGGDLICCDGCPSTFHQSCLDIQMLPPGDWHCPNCICKFCGIAGEVSTVGDSRVISMLLKCSLCEKKYHESCSQEMEPADVNASTSFCGKKCQELFDSLQKLIGVKHELQGGFSWSLIHRTEIDTDVSHRGFPHRVECNSKLAVALFVMNECFLPIVDRRSSINLIHNVLYNCGSNFSRLNYSSFYTAILERGDEIVAAASIRIRGTQLAEMPFIGTRHLYRRQGICRRLLSAIELALCSLKIEKLFIPAIAEHMNTWTAVFGFKPLEESHKQELRSMNMLVFPDTDMLQKPLVAQKTTGENITADSDTKSILIKEDLRHAPDFTKKSSLGHDLTSCDDVIMQNADEIDDKAAVVDTGMEVLGVPFDGNALLHSSGMSCEPKVEVLSDEKVTLQSHSKEKSSESSAVFIKAPLSSEFHNDLLRMETHVLDPSVDGNSSEEKIVGDALKSNVKASVVERVLDSLEETSTIDTTEGDKKPPPVSSVEVTDETTKESNSDLSLRISDRMEYKLRVASESEAKVDDEPVEGNIRSFVKGYKDNNYDAKVKLLDSLGEISAMKGKTKENPDSISVSPSNGNDERTSHLNQPDAVDLPSKLNVASLVNAEVAFYPRFAPVEGNIQSSAVSGCGDAPVLDSLDEFCSHNTAEDVKDNLTRVPFSNLYSDLDRQSKVELESGIPIVGDIDDEGNDGKVVCVEPDLDSFGEISVQKKEINKDMDPTSVSTLNVSAESTIQLNSDLNKQNALEVERHAASEVGLGGSNIFSSAEDDGGREAHEVNVINAPVEISVENGTDEIKAGVAGSTEFHESDHSSVQFESEQNKHCANAMETELL